MTTTYLAVRWSVSRGRDTYGYNICTVTDQNTGKRFSCNGGGYDMLGTSFGEWVTEVHQAALRNISEHAYAYYDQAGDRQHNEGGLYGMTRQSDGRVTLDGGCGIDSMTRIAKAAGLELQRTWDRKGNTTGWIVTSA